MIFFQEKILEKICVPALPKIFRPVTRNTLTFLFGLLQVEHVMQVKHACTDFTMTVYAFTRDWQF